MKYVIGVDLGTSATKTILVDQNGKIVAEASVKYPMYQLKRMGRTGSIRLVRSSDFNN